MADLSITSRRLKALTFLDKAVLLQISKEGFQSFHELRLGPLHDTSQSHSWRMLKRLTQGGLIKKTVDHAGATLGWSIGRDTVSNLRKLIPEIKFALGSAPSYQTAFTHDLLLREIKKAFEQSPRLVGWTSESELRQICGAKSNKHFQSLIPDAVFRISYGKTVLTGILEVELSRKKKARIQSKLERYLLDSKADFILYAVTSPNLAKFVSTQVAEVRKRSVKVRLNPRNIPLLFINAIRLREKGVDHLLAHLEKAHVPLSATQNQYTRA